MKFPPARFRFTAPQQRLLEMALLDATDRTMAAQLGLTEAAIKKRWRSIYAEVRRVAPAILGEDRPSVDHRRALLGYVRQHLEELRPAR